MTKQAELHYQLLRLKRKLDILEHHLIKKEILELDLANVNKELRIFSKIVDLCKEEN